jgi:hypothetical protein
VKRIPPSASATAIFAAQDIRTFMPGGIPFSRAQGWNALGRGDHAQGGMRSAFPPYGYIPNISVPLRLHFCPFYR